MSLLVTAILNDGIIMACDSRTTWTHSDKTVTYQDGSKKLFILNNKIAISTCRNASLHGQTIEWYMNKFIELHKDKKISRVPKLLKDYFLSIKPDCNVAFFVAGYNDSNKPIVYKVYTQQENEKLYTSSPCSYWLGETNFVSRAFGPVYIRKGASYKKHTSYNLLIDKFSIEDGIKYCKYLINSSEEYLKFFDIKQTIGGDTKIVVIKPDRIYWYQ